MTTIAKDKYYCAACNYTTPRLSSWKKHIETRKHRLSTGTDEECIHRCECGRIYSHRQSLSYHKRSCMSGSGVTSVSCADTMEARASSTADNISSKASYVGKDQTRNEQEGDMVTVPAALLRDLVDIVKNQKVTHTTSVVNLRIDNLNLFLSQNCGNAMSIQDFTKNLQIGPEELTTLAKPDVDRPSILSNIIARSLAPLDLTLRPVHCTDHDVWYVKDHLEGWGEDPNKNRLIKETEATLHKRATAVFEDMYPEWMTDDKLQGVYTSFLSSVMSETPKCSEDAIRERISELVKLSEDAFDG